MRQRIVFAACLTLCFTTTTAFQYNNIKNWSSQQSPRISLPSVAINRYTTAHALGRINNQSFRIPSSSFTSASGSHVIGGTTGRTTTTTIITSHAALVSPSDNWGNIAILSSIASISHYLGKSTFVGRLLGPPVTAMAIAFVLGSIGILPSGGSQGQKILQLFSIQLATPLLLLGVNIQQCRKTCGPLLKSFLLASFGTLLACIIAYPICANMLESTMGQDGLKVAAALLAKNVGGGLNYVAVCRSLDVSANAVAAGLCVDNIFALLYFPMTSVLASGRADVVTEDIEPQAQEPQDQEQQQDKHDHDNNSGGGAIQLSTEKVSAVLTMGAMATWLGNMIGGQSGGLPVATMMTVIFTVVSPKIAQSLSKTGEALGTSLLYLFFATAGAPGLAIADSVKQAFVPLGIYLSLLYGIHGAVLAGSRWVFLRKQRRGNIDDPTVESNSTTSSRSCLLPQRLLVASSAAIGGPATAAALAKANNWTSLVGPSLIVGNLGYAIATFMGIGFYALFKVRML